MDNLNGLPVAIPTHSASIPTHSASIPACSASINNLTFKSLMFVVSLGISALGSAGEKSELASGEADYLNYCASCHGVTGEGNGPVAGSLKNRPPDLTYLHQQESDGAFPYKRVLSIIEGDPDHDKNLRTHGPADMPVWGKVIYEDSGQSEAQTKARLRALTNYIKSLQK